MKANEVINMKMSAFSTVPALLNLDETLTPE
jgi:hypothetical protein